MKKLLIAFLLITSISCHKSNDVATTTTPSITDLGFEYGATYKMQQYIQTSSSPITWNFVDMPGVFITFPSQGVVIEKRNANIVNTWSYQLKGAAVSNSYYHIVFIQPAPCSNCPIVLNGADDSHISVNGSYLELYVSSVGSSYYSNYRFIKQ